MSLRLNCILDLPLWYWDAVLRAIGFAGVFSLLALWQYRKPNRDVYSLLKSRWQRHLGIAIVGFACIRVFFYSVFPIEVAFEIVSRHLGLLQMPEWSFLPYGAKLLLGILMLDLVMYAQHRAFHKVGLLWRFHKLHHSDKVLELSTGLRFHPIELIISFIIKILAIVFIGPPVLAVLLFEILHNAAILFAHANVKLGHTLQSILEKCIVTPFMHHIHHSDLPIDYNSNFGFIFSVWDRIFKTYKVSPKLGEKHMNIGLGRDSLSQAQCITDCLWFPFIRMKEKMQNKMRILMHAPENK